MRVFRHWSVLLAAGMIVATGTRAQFNLPRIVQLPTSDFVWNWGEPRRIDDRERPDFTINGVEQSFRCTLNGEFRPGSRMSDYYNLRDFEQALSATINFISEATYTLNDLYLANELQWATMNCVIPVTIESEAKTQERVDKALERAERQRERRRDRDDRDND